MEYSLRAIFYLIRGYINLLLQMEVTEGGVTLGGITFSVMLLSGLFVSMGLFYRPNVIPGQMSLPDTRRK